MATALGGFLVLDPIAGAASVAVFVVAYAVTRISSVGSLLGAAAFPVAFFLRGRPLDEVLISVAVVLLIVIQHRDNLGRLKRGEENEV